MIYFPFIYFSCLLFWSIYKRGYDVYAYIVSIYTISALCSIFVDALNLYSIYDIFSHPLGIVAPITYCGLLTICFQPFKSFKSNRIKSITDINERKYNIIVYTFFILFIINLLASFTKIQDIIFNNALSSIREDFYKGRQESIWSSYSGVFRYFIVICALVSPCSVLMILFFFVNISFLKKSIFFNCITILGSLTKLIHSIFMADRSGFIHFIIIIGLCFILTKKHIPKKKLKYIYLVGGLILSILIFYISSVTISRFGGENGSNMESIYTSLLYYAGSSYIQFCNFFNTLSFDSPISLVPIFPLTYWILDLPSYFDQADIVENYYHHGVSNFSTFLGMILSISGRIVMIIFVATFYVISSKIIYRKKYNVISIKKLLYFFVVALVVSNGLFGYYYMSSFSVVQILIWILIARWIFLKRHQTNQ